MTKSLRVGVHGTCWSGGSSRSAPARLPRARCARTIVVASTLTMVAAGGMSAHRRDEYLQAARVALDPGVMHLELDLTPGIALAAAIIADIDRNGDGSLSPDEQQAYARLVVSALTIEVDGRSVGPDLGSTTFPEPEAMRRGEGTIRLQSAAALPQLSVGPHQLLFRNRHHLEGSVYLANALVPGSDAVAVTGQRRDSDQTELTIDYVLHGAAPASRRAWLLGSVAAAIALLLAGLRQLRRWASSASPGRA